MVLLLLSFQPQNLVFCGPELLPGGGQLKFCLLHRPLGRLLRLAVRSSVGLAALALLNQIGLGLGVNLVNALILGVLGVPGLGLLLMLQWVLRT